MIHHTQISTQNELDLNIKPETLKFLEKNIENLLLNIAILFTISKTWKQSKCPTVEKEDVRYTCTPTEDYYSAIKREILPLVMTCIDLEGIMLSEIN